MVRTSYMPLSQRESRRDDDNTSFAHPHHEDLSTSSLHFLLRGLRTTATTLVPSFLHRSPRNPRPVDVETSRVPSNSLSTDWLDGLRGVASFIVFLFHYCIWSHPSIRWGYGADGVDTGFLQLPIICLVTHGRAMVAIFFVISGYALSFSTLQSIQKKDHDKLFTRLSSSVFRRAIRLYLPALASAFLHYMAQRIGIKGRKDRVSTFRSDTTDFLVEIQSRMSPFSWSAQPIDAFYNQHLWTIPVEFRSSIILFVTVLGLSRTRCSVRMLTIIGLFFYSMIEHRWDTALFMAGIVLAEANLLQEQYVKILSSMDDDIEKGRVESAVSSTMRKSIQVTVNAGLVSLLIGGCYLASFPTKGSDTSPWFMWMHRLGSSDPEFNSRLWTSLGAVMITTSVSFMPRCQAVFETDLICYLGRISYSLYLVHGLLNKVLGKPIVKWMWSMCGKEDWIRYEGAWLLGTIIYIPIVIWVADIFWRVVDTNTVKMAKNIERRCCVSS